MTKTDDLLSTGLDRRSMLKKAAVGGAIAWTAPALLSSRASAVDFIGACTAKCAPKRGGTVGGTISVTGCQAQGPLSECHPFKFRVNSLASQGSACGCGGAPVFSTVGTEFTMGTNDWNHAYCTGTNGPNHIGYVGRYPGRTGTGTPVFVAIDCKDRQGRTIRQQCEVAGRFEYCHNQPGANQTCPATPAGGAPCSTFNSRIRNISWIIIACTQPPVCV